MKWIALFLFSCSLFATEDIGGFWKSLDDNGKPQCIFGVYEHEGVYYGRIIGTYDTDGEMRDTIYKPKAVAEGISGTPHMCGLDILYNLYDNGISFKGKILDPTKGNVYNCEVWPQNGDLIVRGKVLMFGKNITWYATTPKDFPKNFKLPDMKTFTPSIPQPN
ncbi:MAG TPA: DUF2147 domain-containing protein [Chlamydiales bacterium]|nr:DUF2147 domain-containing protein [Chlamydiales bacterium]